MATRVQIYQPNPDEPIAPTNHDPEPTPDDLGGNGLTDNENGDEEEEENNDENNDETIVDPPPLPPSNT
jgi:hypothetical protein